MHFSALVIIGPDGDPALEVEKVLAPYVEEYKDDDGNWQYNETGWWDWYQIGGRWTGHFDDYDPNADPANIEVCNLCNGTGKRNDMVVANGCNGCRGTGSSTKWPTEWSEHSGDVVTTEQAAAIPDLTCHRLVTLDSCEEDDSNWTDEEASAKWNERVRQTIAKIPGGRVVVVDYHS